MNDSLKPTDRVLFLQPPPSSKNGDIMTRPFLLLSLALLLTLSLGCGGNPLPDGHLLGTVIRESTGQPVPFPVIVISRVLQSPLQPDQTGKGDKDGKFLVTVAGGNYNIKISTKEAGPFYTWPNVVFVEPNKLTTETFVLPDGF
jgi:hypothetical protein